MITGDARATAVSIAKQCNILKGDPRPGEVMEGKEFREFVGGLVYDEDDTKKLYPRVKNLKNM